jgi:hypothetical protein
VGAHGVRALALRAEETVDERGFPDPGRSDQRGRVARREAAFEPVETFARRGAQGQHAHSRRHVLGSAYRRRELVRPEQVRLVEGDDRLRAAVPGQDERALEAPRVVVAVEARDDHDDIHVRGHDLHRGERSRHLSCQVRAPGQDFLKQRRPVARGQSHADPVADGRTLRLAARPMAQAPRQLRRALALRRPQHEGVAVDGDHPRGHVGPCVGYPVPGDTPAVVPSKVFESTHARLLPTREDTRSGTHVPPEEGRCG